MWLIAGLGNPGTKYALHRHNIGFMAVDTFIRSIEIENKKSIPEKSEMKGLSYHLTLVDDKASEKVILCKPQTFMNLSGDTVRGLMDFYKIEAPNLIVLHDEIELPFKQMKVQVQRGHGGHNGVRDIHEKLGHNNYYRIRLGIGRPAGQMEVSNHVLGNFSKEEVAELPDFLHSALDAIESLIFKGYEKTANKFNSPPKPT